MGSVSRPGSAGAPAGLAPDDLTDSDFAAVLLRALIDMAARSQRHEADLLAALRGARLTASAPRLRMALRLLQVQGCIRSLVPLSDGGLLLTVTRQAMEHAGPLPQWLPLEDLDASVASATTLKGGTPLE